MTKFIQVIKDRRYVFLGVIIVAILCSPLLYKVAQPSYEATSQLSYIGSGSASQTISINNAILPASDLPDLAMSSEVIDKARHMAHVDESIDDLRLKMTIKGSPHSNVIPIAVRSKIRSQALVLANDIADATVWRYKTLVSSQYDDVLARLQEQMNDEQQRIHQADAALQKSVEADSAVGAADSLDVISKNLTDLESQRATAYATYVADKAASSAQPVGKDGHLTNAIREQILTADPSYQAMATSQAKDAAALSAVKAGYTDKFPGLAGLAVKVQSEKVDVDRAASAAVANHPGNSLTYSTLALNAHTAAALTAGDKARVDAIDQNIREAQGSLKDLPKYGVAADVFRGERDSANAAYQQLEVRYQQTLTDRTQAAALGAAFVLDHATMATPRIPEFVLATLIVLFVLGLAVGAAYLAEALNPRIRTAVDVEDLYGAPRIGMV